MSVTVPYSTGYRAEREAAKYLEAQGYYVMTSRGSKGMFDLIAVSPEEVKLIQVKVIPTNAKRIFKKEQLEIRRVQTPPFVKKEFWIYEKRRGWHFHPC